jgi:hypothetical protein
MVFGGSGLNDTWLWNGNSSSWTKVFDDTVNPSPSTSQPSQRSGYGFAYNSNTQQFIVFGGYANGGTSFDDTWILSQTPTPTWELVQPPVQQTESPAARAYPSLVYYTNNITNNNECVLFGGVANDGTELNDTWIFDCATNGWMSVIPRIAPPVRMGHSMAYDSSSGSVILFGGADFNNYYSDVWSWNGTVWEDVTPVSGPDGPDGRWFAMMAYSSVQDRIILFGGNNDNGDLSDTWSFNNATKTWTYLGQLGIPATMTGYLQEDTTTGLLILFGPNSGWSWNGTTWTQLTATPQPDARRFD